MALVWFYYFLLEPYFLPGFWVVGPVKRNQRRIIKILLAILGAYTPDTDDLDRRHPPQGSVELNTDVMAMRKKQSEEWNPQLKEGKDERKNVG